MSYMETDETVGDDETKTTIKIPTDLLDDFKHLAIDMKTTVTALIVESITQYLKDIRKK
jgi:predicted transcriptional regulator